jgi:aminoglycoside 6'-N-acetyltransferase I
MVIRHVEASDRTEWIRLRYELWPQACPPHEQEIDRFFGGRSREPESVLVAEVEGELVGFAELSIRPRADGCVTDRVAYLEGWYVEPDWRGHGLGKALVAAAERWARQQGCLELASDTDIDNELSLKVHKALGFEEVGQIRCFRKSL